MISFQDVSKAYPTATVVDRVTFDVPTGETCVLLGPSGCGKTTLLKMVNRLIPKTGGRITVDGEDIDRLDATTLRRRVGYAIQQVGLFPNMTVEENIGVVPGLLGWDRQRTRERAAELMGMMALDPALLSRYPAELSGGQAQRVGVARAFAADPPVLLMDEPFGAVDPVNRAAIQAEFVSLQRRLRKTVVFVSHDLDEALKLGDRIAIMREGRLVQCDTPDAVLARPADEFVAEFVGGDRTLKRLRLIKVADAMMPDPPRVTGEDTLETAVARMHEHGHISIVMVGPRGRARGMVRLDQARGKKGLVSEHVEPLPGVIDVGDDLRNAVSMMFSHGATWLACVDEEGFYRGYVTQRGITQLLGSSYRD
jgi:osmoprotectant transport system ATP-binding protein